MAGLLRSADWIGTVSFAYSGSLLAAAAGMDAFGSCVVGCITAVGGGTVRDLLIGNAPVFWMQEVEYLAMSIVAALAAFISLPAGGLAEDGLVLRWTDHLGVAAFAVIGAQNGLRRNLAPLICVV